MRITASVGTTDLTGPQCSPNTVQWTFDVYMLPKATTTAILKNGGDRWVITHPGKFEVASVWRLE
jgi:branched-chain amino acid transport system substrate-binding protein